MTLSTKEILNNKAKDLTVVQVMVVVINGMEKRYWGTPVDMTNWDAIVKKTLSAHISLRNASKMSPANARQISPKVLTTTSIMTSISDKQPLADANNQEVVKARALPVVRTPTTDQRKSVDTSGLHNDLGE
ncbi:hypothetical protein H4R33_007202 [Dimargaris cristalligena]|nr:hypothetical protein H4R33_007202 [Dimargaris cristalligena]